MVQDSKSRPMGTYYVREAIRRAIRSLMRRWFFIGWALGCGWMYLWRNGGLPDWAAFVVGAVTCIICYALIDRQTGKSVNR